jgi:hypothetical protein
MSEREVYRREVQDLTDTMLTVPHSKELHSVINVM